MSTVLLIAATYVVLVLGMYLAQDRLIYFPDSAGVAQASRVRLEPWPAGDSHLGFVSLTAPPEPKGTFLVWHGNAGSALDRVYYSRALERRGYRVVLLEYPGYGGREGSRREASFVAEGKQAAQRAAEEFGGPLFLLGESMGGAIATAVAADGTIRIAGLVLITPWADLPGVAQAAYPFIPAKWLVRDKYDNVCNLRDYSGPVAVVMCDKDEVVPNRETERLFASIGSPKRLWRFGDAHHNDWPAAPHEMWWDEVVEFVTVRSAPDTSGAAAAEREGESI
jgi:alpha-beta hydrolase superfamily lysophospholipase